MSTRDLRDALKEDAPASRPLRGRVVEVASKLLSLGFHTGDPIKTITVITFLISYHATNFQNRKPPRNNRTLFLQYAKQVNNPKKKKERKKTKTKQTRIAAVPLIKSSIGYFLVEQLE